MIGHTSFVMLLYLEFEVSKCREDSGVFFVVVFLKERWSNSFLQPCVKSKNTLAVTNKYHMRTLLTVPVVPVSNQTTSDQY